ncbi:MAG: hypothetical protein KAS87_01485 [Candidatus Omnitrophica bacterium]|nr:hypothetical protein [Candidatus Omnitrophota bacterium]
MKKIILGLFIALFCFSIGIAGLQEKKPSEEEIKIIKKQKEKEVIISYLIEELEKLIKKVEIPPEGDPKLYYGEMANLCEEMSKMFKKIAILCKEIVELEKDREEKYGFSFLDRIKPLEEKNKGDIIWLDSLYESHGLGKTEVEKLKEENDRLEDLLREIRNERSGLEWDMMMYKWDLENAKPDPLDYQMALNSAIASAMIAPHPFKYDSWIYPYYPSYSTRTDRTNYEPLLFLLSTNSSGKMDWTKYGWLKLLLKKK